jgi:predicted nucleic acid-binding protein
MKPLRVYLDTSILGGRLDEEFSNVTEAMIEAIAAGEIRPVISDVVKAELAEAPEQVLDVLVHLEELGAETVLSTREADELAMAYIDAGVVTVNYLEDALHIAIATIARVDVLTSWNFKHIVNLRRIQGFNGVNLLRGYQPLEIRSPREVLAGETTSENQDL